MNNIVERKYFKPFFFLFLCVTHRAWFNILKFSEYIISVQMFSIGEKINKRYIFFFFYSCAGKYEFRELPILSLLWGWPLLVYKTPAQNRVHILIIRTSRVTSSVISHTGRRYFQKILPLYEPCTAKIYLFIIL